MSTAPSSNKYYIKSLEEEIGLFERKIAHLLKFETFPSDDERQVAADKLTAKRDRLIRTVRDLTEGTAEVKPAPVKKLKPAVKTKTSTRASAARSAAALAQPISESAAPVAEQPVLPDADPSTPRIASPFAGTSLDSELELRNYLQKRAKSPSA